MMRKFLLAIVIAICPVLQASAQQVVDKGDKHLYVTPFDGEGVVVAHARRYSINGDLDLFSERPFYNQNVTCEILAEVVLTQTEKGKEVGRRLLYLVRLSDERYAKEIHLLGDSGVWIIGRR